MQKHRFFLHIVFLFLAACSSKDWSSVDQDVVDLSIRGDALYFSNGFSIALIEGAVPEKTVDGTKTTVRWKQGNIELALEFLANDPEVKLLSDFNVQSKELALISGRMMSEKGVTANFGGADFGLSQSLMHSPSGTGSLYISEVMQLHLPFLYSIQKNEKATRWRYVDAVDLSCKISGSASVGYLRLGLPRVDVFHREPKLGAQIVTLISAGEEDQAVLTQKINTIMNGHSQATDPRFGNGGLAIAEGSSTFIGTDPGKFPNVSFIAPDAGKDCKTIGLSHLKGDPDMLYFPGVGYLARSEHNTSRIFRNASLKKIQASGLTRIVHLVLDDKLLIKDGEDWTLSERSALDFADLELFAEEGKIEVLGARDYFERLEKLSKVSWSWSPDGSLTFECKECGSIPGFLVKVENSATVNIDVKPKSYRQKVDVHRWDFEEGSTTFKFENYRPKGINWRFQQVK